MTSETDQQPPADEDRGERDEQATRPREPVFNLPVVVTTLIAICAGIYLLRSYVLTVDQDIGLIVRFAFIPLRYSGGYPLDVYAFASPFTYSFLHGGLAHLAVNMIWLAAFGSPLANRIGASRFVAFWLFTSLAAVVLHYVLHIADQSPVVGASGAISGMMGAAARFGFRIERRDGKAAFAGRILSIPAVFRSRTAVTFLVVWMAVNLLMGFGFGAPDADSRVAWEAHIGGFLAGFLLVRLFDRPARGAG
jgi:membrane associated rhomboid family serine protease